MMNWQWIFFEALFLCLLISGCQRTLDPVPLTVTMTATIQDVKSSVTPELVPPGNSGSDEIELSEIVSPEPVPDIVEPDVVTVTPEATGYPDARITIIYDNTAYDKRLTPVWGFAALVEYGDFVMLFDTGGDATTLLRNMELLGIDPARIQAVVLSHIHGDHIGGMVGLLETGVQPTVYVLPSFNASFKQQIAAYTSVIEVIPGQVIVDGLVSTGELHSGIIPEQALVVETPEGQIVITGCAHPGIVEIIQAAKDLSGSPIHLVLGGFHLMDKSTLQIQEILATFRALEVKQVMPTHCTGEVAIKMFAEEYGMDYIQGGAGRVIEVGQMVTQIDE